MDPQTQLYYFGARYYDPRTSVWQSADPILEKYLEDSPNGGIQLSLNLSLYNYGLLNPVQLTDPDGRAAACSSDDDVCQAMGPEYLSYHQEREERRQNIVEGMSVAGDVAEAAVPVPGGAVLTTAGKGSKIWNAFSKLFGKLFGGKGDDLTKAATVLKDDAVETTKLLASPRKHLLDSVTDEKLKNRVNSLYRQNAEVGTGSTADAIRYELRTGKLLSPQGHMQKGIEMRNGLLSDLNSGRLNETDYTIARQLLKDLQNALSGQ